MEKVLILGADGNLGEQLRLEFSKKNNYEIVSYTKNDLNLLEADLIGPKIDKVKANIIINATAYNAVDKCEEFAEEYKIAKKINGEALRQIARSALKNDAILIHYSTDYVFGGDTCQEDDCAEECLLEFKEKGGFKEDDVPCPINKYGETKLMGEKEILKLAERKLKYYIIRTSKLFGPKGKSDDAKENFFDLILRISQTQNIIKVVGEELSCFTYTPDLAKQTLDIVEEKKPWGIYHVRNNDPAIWYDAAVELFRVKGLRVMALAVSASEFPRPAKRPKYSVLANTKLPALRSWKEALKDYIKTIN